MLQFFPENCFVRILPRHILKEVVSHSLLGLLLFTFVLFLRDTTRILELLLRDTSLWESVARVALLAMPSLLTFTIPMSVLVGILIGLTRMASDGEVTAMRASGIGAGIFAAPLGIFIGLGCALTLYLSIVIAPAANQERVGIERQIGLRQISGEIQPRVFEERFPNWVLYVQDIRSGPNPLWQGIFLADLTNPDGPKVTFAREGIFLSNPDQNQVQLHLTDGSIHEASTQSNEYSIATFSETDIPLRLPPPPPSAVKPNARRSTAELAEVAPGDPEWLDASFEYHRRFALPFAALFLSLVGIPLGLSSEKGGKAMGIILTLLMVVAYYSLFIGGMSLARQGWVSPWLGVWLANLLFGVVGFFLVSRLDRIKTPLAGLGRVAEMPEAIREWFASRRARGSREAGGAAPFWNTSFPRILDRYVVKSFVFYWLVTVAALILLTHVVTFFLDLLNDVIRNQVPAEMVLEYFLHLTPQLLYITAPLGVLIAILVSFGVLSQRNELTAVKASGISLYRMTVPIFLLAGMLSAGLFAFEHFLIPQANRRQDAVRNRIKGRPAQTYLRPDRRWILGDGWRIFYYNYFAPDERVLGGVTVFEFDPSTFQLSRRISAERARWETPLNGWVFEEGWVRELEGNSVRAFQTFPVRLFPELHELPAYFLKEVRQSSQMNFIELSRYVQDLRQSGFDVVPLDVQFHKKFSFPLFALIMAFIAVPFAFSLGKKGALTGIAVSIGVAIAYWAVSSLFEALGNLNELPAVAAAWSPNVIFGLGGLYLLLRVET
jgi:LPS export ABC transporter permease LptG/LPS export ABC transporter permease LptF